MAEFTIGGIPLTKPSMDAARITALIWGPVGSGKTPFAMTAPAPILYIQFDVDGHKSVSHVSERFDMMDVTGAPLSIVDSMIKTDTRFMKEIDATLATGRYKSVVIDSMTAFIERALTRGVEAAAIAMAGAKGTKPTDIMPGLQGYGARATLTNMMAWAWHNVCAKHNVSLVLVAHDKATLNADGSTEKIEPWLPGQTGVQIPKNISEIWCLRDLGGKLGRNIYLRPFARYEGMRTRMFDTGDTNGFFKWQFDANKWEGPGQIELWLDQWRKNGGSKIPMPK